MRLTDSARLLELFSDGLLHSHHERYGLNLVANSRVSDLREAGYSFWPEPPDRPSPPDYLMRLLGVPEVASQYELQLESAGAWGAAAALKRMRFAGQVTPASLHTTSESGSMEAASVGGEPELGLPARASSRPGVERDNQAAPDTSTLFGAPGDGGEPSPVSLLESFGEVGAPPRRWSCAA